MPRRKTRRSPGEGTEWQDKKTGQWRWRIRWEGKNHTVSDLDRTRAREKYDRLRDSLRKSIDVPGGKQTLTEYLSYWLEEDIRRNSTESTHHDYRKRCELYIVKPLGHYRLRDLTPRIIRRWANATRDNYALSSARQALALLKRALQLAFEEKLIDDNPAAAVTIAQALRESDDEDDEEARALTPEQVELLLADIRSHDRHHAPMTGPSGRGVRSTGMYVLYMLAVWLGLRRGEVLGLRRKDVDLENAILRVRQQVIRLDNTYRISKTLKTKAAKRDLPLTAPLVSLLRPHILRVGAADDDLLFPAKNGGPLNPSTVTQHFARACRRVGISGFVFHSLRATAISRWRKAGVQAEVAGALAGHEKPDVTLEVYSEVDMERKRAAIERAG
jgi:integrase